MIVGRPPGSRAVVRNPAGLWKRNSRDGSSAATGWPSTVMPSRLETTVAGVVSTWPSSATLPSAIIRSMSRREPMPARASNLAMRCGSTGTPLPERSAARAATRASPRPRRPTGAAVGRSLNGAGLRDLRSPLRGGRASALGSLFGTLGRRPPGIWRRPGSPSRRVSSASASRRLWTITSSAARAGRGRSVRPSGAAPGRFGCLAPAGRRGPPGGVPEPPGGRGGREGGRIMAALRRPGAAVQRQSPSRKPILTVEACAMMR